MKQLNKSANQLNRIAQRLSRSNDRFAWKFIGIGVGIFFALVMGLVAVSAWYIPSLDEIQKRRICSNVKIYALQIRETSNGKTLVRIMLKKTCHIYQPSNLKDKTFDWC